MTLPSALLTLFLLPDFPHNSRSRFLSQDEIALAIARKEAEGYSPVTGKIGFSLIKRVLFNWRLYVISIVYLIVSSDWLENHRHDR
jgi:ACS family pantothenate transporter-like MFS transporter